ncbi:hypothetical protein CCP3SC5AM1_2380002 [Gammaproteobacteria bacterium]
MNTTNDMVVKSNYLIEASYRLSLVEQRIILSAIAESKRTGKGISDFVIIRAIDYAKMFNVQENKSYEQIKDAAKTLFSRYVTFYEIDKNIGEKGKSEVRWLSAASYFDRSGMIKIRFAQDMIPYITQLEMEFTRYRLEKIAGMSSPYAIRLYELLMQWISIKKRDMELEWLKKTLMVEEEYQRLFDLKKRVINVAVKQINEHSDLTVEYTQRKTGRNVTHILFTFNKKESQPGEMALVETASTIKTAPTTEADDCFSGAAIKISKANQARLLKIRTPDEIRQCIAIANRNLKKAEKDGDRINNPGAYYATAIRDGWHMEQHEEQKEQEQKKQDEARTRLEIEERIAYQTWVSEVRGIEQLNLHNARVGLPPIQLPPKPSMNKKSSHA